MENAEQLSVAVAVPVAVVVLFAVHCMVTFAGQVMSGATVSITLINWLQLLTFPQASVAVHVLVIT